MEQQIITNGGLQHVPQIAVQYVYLDFDGELTSYNGEILTVDNVEVQNSSLTEKRIADIVAELNAKYADKNVIFVTEKPENAEYSTIYIGKTSAFEQYGNFAGVAETIDKGNQIKTDNAFVNLDATASDAEIISTISHETCHLLGTLDHGGDGLQAYAAIYVSSGVSSNGIEFSQNNLYIKSGGTACDTVIGQLGKMYVSSGGSAHNTTVKEHGYMYISSGGTATAIKENGGYVEVYYGAEVTFLSHTISNVLFNNRDKVTIHANTSATGCNLDSASSMYVYSGAAVDNTTVKGYLSSGGSYSMLRLNGGIANSTTLKTLGCLYVTSGGVANNTSVEGNGELDIHSKGMANDTVLSGSWIAGVQDLASMTISSGGVANNTLAKGFCELLIFSGGVANNTVVHGGSVTISAGGSANSATVIAGTLYVNGSGHANNINLAYDGEVVVNYNGHASIEFTPWHWNYGSVSSQHGAYVTYLERDANIYYGCLSSGTVSKGNSFNGSNITDNHDLIVYSGGIANNNTIYNGNMHISSGGTANSTTVSSGTMSISSGGAANNTTLHVLGALHISSGGVANNTILHEMGAAVYISSGGVANSTTVDFGGEMYISGKHTGTLQIDDGAVISAYSGSIIDFTVADRSIEDGYIINNLSAISGTPDYTITVSDTQAVGTYKLAQNSAGFSGTISIGSDTAGYGSLTVNEDALIYNDTAYLLNNTNGNLTLSVKAVTIKNLQGDCNNIAWNTVPQVSSCTVEYSTNNFANSLRIAPATNAVDTYGLPQGNYQWKVSDGESWYNGNNIVANDAAAPQQLVSDADGNMDLFFANANGTWEDGFEAEHQGIYNNWIGSREHIALEGKNKIADVFAGSDDANILVLTDDANGDALFVDDVFTVFGKDAARLSQIDEIRAGLGDDIVDLTSQKFAYAGDGVKVYGGLGNDTIWANNGKNILFGDAGNDRIVGGSGDDVIIGGVGNDSMHGGGGSDIFCFGEDWGSDTVEQLAGGAVTLWFESGAENNWDANTLTYTDGANSVTVSGVANVTLRFGADASLPAGCFDDAASEKIFEDKDKGMLA